eukprot:TRINITY_DN1073_c0_g1_i1.p1 TRINITY_DN1073_c0_g1~~TRINITY_DN1073_c0_g1_i1.p1  ORF type:complete len:173 (+),score=21.72 TRINITY_DN1073_c0_g1_i1:116-634(+)
MESSREEDMSLMCKIEHQEQIDGNSNSNNNNTNSNHPPYLLFSSPLPLLLPTSAITMTLPAGSSTETKEEEEEKALLHSSTWTLRQVQITKVDYNFDSPAHSSPDYNSLYGRWRYARKMGRLQTTVPWSIFVTLPPEQKSAVWPLWNWLGTKRAKKLNEKTSRRKLKTKFEN